ncbi:uncharacterized protein LOC112347258 [Selaginella moellendorffii]|uniref:uncharacterized protein LOC112347258 n=1 Tax=Selaginella moellendorffii TaxID=88036 RepID=UPI000D1C80D2|nr:uncharacterized protein LOC112347258 [Selaginella moellendorffii]|eukprot:XP_024533650.1 uncharacterized protein LOC112347258 [Selaginella moellendorffii]
MEGVGIRRRSSRLSGMFDAASKAVAQLIQRDNDPEEDPDFIARNPRWEDRLPPIGGALKPEEEKTAALLAALGDLPRATDSLPRKNWKKAYKAVKRMLLYFLGGKKKGKTQCYRDWSSTRWSCSWVLESLQYYSAEALHVSL